MEENLKRKNLKRRFVHCGTMLEIRSDGTCANFFYQNSGSGGTVGNISRTTFFIISTIEWSGICLNFTETKYSFQK